MTTTLRSRILISMFLLLTAASSVKSSMAALEPIQEVFEPAAPAHPEAFVKVAVIQWAPEEMTPVGVTPEQAEAVKRKNRARLLELLTEAADHGAKLLLTPELSFIGYPDIPELPSEEDEYRSREDIAPYVETIPGPSTDAFGAFAKARGVWVHLGLAERDAITDRYHNAVAVISPEGQVIAKYRKRNLYEAENKFFEPGTEWVTYQGPVGKTSLMICADIYDSAGLRAVKAQKGDAIALSASWAQANTGMSYFRGAAVRTGAYVMASNHRYFPDSGVIEPSGLIQSHIRQTRIGIAYGYLPRKEAGVRELTEAAANPSPKSRSVSAE